MKKVLNRNTHLCVDVKTFLRNERIAKLNKQYTGVLTRDAEERFTFVETQSLTDGRRSPRVYDGKYITVTVRDDGSFHPNFKNMRVGADFTVDGYALGVCDELRRALTGLVGR